MEIYLDIIIISNCFINFSFLYFIEKSFGEKINYLRIIVASIIGSLFILLYFTDYVYALIFKIIGGALIVMIGITSVDKSKQIIKISLFYALNFAFIGFLQSFRINEWYLLIVSLIVILGLFLFETNRKYFIFVRNCKYNIIVKMGSVWLKLEGFLDTGNECFYKEIPVIFINNKFKPKNLTSYDVMSISTVNGIKLEYYFKPDEFWIKIKNKKMKKEVYIVFSDIEKECIINPYLII